MPLLILPIITFDASSTQDVVDWAGTIVGDLMPLLVIIIGLAIGAWIIRAIIQSR